MGPRFCGRPLIALGQHRKLQYQYRCARDGYRQKALGDPEEVNVAHVCLLGWLKCWTSGEVALRANTQQTDNLIDC